MLTESIVERTGSQTGEENEGLEETGYSCVWCVTRNMLRENPEQQKELLNDMVKVHDRDDRAAVLTVLKMYGKRGCAFWKFI